MKHRSIEPSNGYLKKVQKKIDRRLLKVIVGELPEEIMGGRKGYSVVDNAQWHIDAEAIMKYDVSNFFPSVSDKHVYDIFRYRLNFCEEAANILKFLTTYKGHLPQGAPTSTSLAILALEPTFLHLKEYCGSRELKLSIWIDDITISGAKARLELSRGDISNILRASPFVINPDKDTGIVQKGSKLGMNVTGISIDHQRRMTIGRARLRIIRNSILRKHRSTDRIWGKLMFLHQVNPKQARKLIHQYKENKKI